MLAIPDEGRSIQARLGEICDEKAKKVRQQRQIALKYKNFLVRVRAGVNFIHKIIY